MNFDRSGGLDDLLYWYAQDVVTGEAAKKVGDRAERFKYEYQVLSEFNAEWAKRNVRETAELFRRVPPAGGHRTASRVW